MAVQTSFTHADLEALWVLYGGLQIHADVAAAIAQAESGGCLYAKAGPTDDRPKKICTYRHTTLENSYGLWQINRQAHPTYSAKSLYTAAGNARAAVAISQQGASFGAWSTYTNGAYKQYLTGTVSVTPQPGPTYTPDGPPEAPHVHRGYADVRNSINRHLPTQLERSRQTGIATLRNLSRLSKVRH